MDNGCCQNEVTKNGLDSRLDSPAIPHGMCRLHLFQSLPSQLLQVIFLAGVSPPWAVERLEKTLGEARAMAMSHNQPMVN